MSSGTMYLSIPKERAATILTGNLSRFEVDEDTGDEIVVTKKVGTIVADAKEAAVLENYNTGQDCKVEYQYDEVFEELQDYTL